MKRTLPSGKTIPVAQPTLLVHLKTSDVLRLRDNPLAGFVVLSTTDTKVLVGDLVMTLHGDSYVGSLRKTITAATLQDWIRVA